MKARVVNGQIVRVDAATPEMEEKVAMFLENQAITTKADLLAAIDPGDLQPEDVVAEVKKQGRLLKQLVDGLVKIDGV